MTRNGTKALAGVQDLLPLDDVVDGVICLRDGDYRAVLEAGSVNFALKSETEQEATADHPIRLRAGSLR